MLSYPYIVKMPDGARFFLGEAEYDGSPSGVEVVRERRGTFIKGSLSAMERAIDAMEASPSQHERWLSVLNIYSSTPAHPFVRLMGILNVTPDSFSDGGDYFTRERAVERGITMVQEGADWVDVGGESTRPGADPVPISEEIHRVIPVIRDLAGRVDVPISIDTTHPATARAAFDAGATWVNDVSGLTDPAMATLVAERQGGVIIMHRKGTPKTMQINPSYDHLFAEIAGFLNEHASRAIEAGIPREKIILDPGIGFGKRMEENYAIVNHLDFLHGLGFPLCLGVSRKSFLGHVVGGDPKDRLPATLAVNALAVVKGAGLLRVHDVAPHHQLREVLEATLHG